MKTIGIKLLCILVFCAGIPHWLISQSPADLGAVESALKERALQRGLDPQDLEELLVTDHFTSGKMTHVHWQQTVNGIGIHHAVANAAVGVNGKIVWGGNAFLKGIGERINAEAPALDAGAAIAAAADFFGLGSPGPMEIVQSEEGPTRKTVVLANSLAQEEIPCRLVYQLSDQEVLRLCWEVTILTREGNHWWNARVDAVNGNVLDANDYIVECALPEPRPATSAEALPQPLALYAPPPNSYEVFPDPVESPSHGARQVVSNPSDPVASPFGWHDTDGLVGAEFTITRGNNVWAMEDQNADNGVGASPDGGATLDFSFPLDLTNQPNTYTDAALTNLFFWNNRIHDVLYHYGFDEVSGNFQENNYGNGGAGTDYVLADGQDGGGFNNANFGTPPDGGNPRMQMFLWTGNSQTLFEVTAPVGIAGLYTAIPAGFGPALTTVPIVAPLVQGLDGSGNPTECCNAVTNGAALSGNIALVDRGNCNFTDKVLNTQAAGALACVVCQNDATAPFAMGGGAGGITIPSVMISQADCNLLKAQLGTGVTLSLSNTGPAVNRDGDFDNGVIAHEYAHGVSNRLVGGPSNAGCLGNDEQMGEGWSDFLGLIMTMEVGDAPTDGRGIGTYAVSQAPNGPGIRPAPYTTDMALNPFTYGDITNGAAISRPHGIGFLFCNMLWEMTWGLVNATGFDPDLDAGTGGNNIALQLVLDGMKLTPCNPGFVDARDAILQADTLNYNGLYSCIIWEAFAKRGLGVSADQGSSGSRNDGSEAFDVPVCVPLPVSNLLLTATAGSSEIRLDWEVSKEKDSQGYFIERRTAEERKFSEMGFVASRGDTERGHSYDFQDDRALPGERYIYRLRQLDLNGAEHFSNLAEAQLEGRDLFGVKLYPNPSSGRVHMEVLLEESADLKVQIVNVIGKTVWEQNWSTQHHMKEELDLSALPKGHYTVKVVAGERMQVRKLILN